MFSLSWFTTIPGILITIGVLLLIIALVIFIITNKKGKKEKEELGGTKEVSAPPNNTGMPAAPAPSIITTNQPPIDTSNNAYGQGVPTIVEENNPVGNMAGANMTMSVMPTPMDIPAPTQVTSPYVTSTPSGVSMLNSVEPQITEAPSVGNADTLNMNLYQNTAVPNNEVNLNNMSASTNANTTIPTITTIDNSNNNITSPYSTSTINEPVTQTIMPEESTPSIISTVVNEPTNTLNGVNNSIPNQEVIKETNSNMTREMPTITQALTQSENSQPAVPTIELNSPTVDQVLPEMQSQGLNMSVAPTVPTSPSPAAEVVPNVQKEVEQRSVNNTPIYGGVGTILPETQPEVPHQIYGGANPLESTQQVPISQIANGINNTNMASSQAPQIVTEEPEVISSQAVVNPPIVTQTVSPAPSVVGSANLSQNYTASTPVGLGVGPQPAPSASSGYQTPNSIGQTPFVNQNTQ